MCIDYRTLNSRMIPDQYIATIDDTLDCLLVASGSRSWISSAVIIRYLCPKKSAFICPLRFYHFECMPQGITGAPATFQRLMEKAVSDMHLPQAVVYLYDIIVFDRTLKEHEERLLRVLNGLEECGLKVSIVKYVGHIVSSVGVAPDPEKVAAVTQWKMSTDLKSLLSFLGFCGFYCSFIKGYSTIVTLLTELTKGYPPLKGQRKSDEKN
ncbi:hypothetical protein QQF64_006290 [Cirrhinus molitorella]|uniref:ribonuclease H n=1 Tax=Cirrhinus molitorella TaxID=172907 RepID=A0ABR3MGU2_9TELE